MSPVRVVLFLSLLSPTLSHSGTILSDSILPLRAARPRLYLIRAPSQTYRGAYPRRPVGECRRCACPHSLIIPCSNDLILYTVTNDSTLRIFLPVLDSPQHLQLHASLDLFSSLPFSIASNYSDSKSSSIFWLDREIIGNVLSHISKERPDQDDARSRRIKEIKDEGWDLFLRVLGDGSIVVTAVAVSPPLLSDQGLANPLS